MRRPVPAPSVDAAPATTQWARLCALTSRFGGQTFPDQNCNLTLVLRLCSTWTLCSSLSQAQQSLCWMILSFTSLSMSFRRFVLAFPSPFPFIFLKPLAVSFCRYSRCCLRLTLSELSLICAPHNGSDCGRIQAPLRATHTDTHTHTHIQRSGAESGSGVASGAAHIRWLLRCGRAPPDGRWASLGSLTVRGDP